MAIGILANSAATCDPWAALEAGQALHTHNNAKSVKGLQIELLFQDTFGL